MRITTTGSHELGHHRSAGRPVLARAHVCQLSDAKDPQRRRGSLDPRECHSHDRWTRPDAQGAGNRCGDHPAGPGPLGQPRHMDGDQLAFDYQWKRCDSTGAGCSSIPGAAAATYTLTAGDLASTLRIDVVGRSPRLRDLAAVTPVVAGRPGRRRHRRRGLPEAPRRARCSPSTPVAGCRRLHSPTSGGAVTPRAARASTSQARPRRRHRRDDDSRSTLRVLVVATNAAGAGGAISAATPVIP